MLQSIAERALGGLELALQAPTRRPDRLPGWRRCVPTGDYASLGGDGDAVFTDGARDLLTADKVELVHCKFSGGSAAGGRSSDLDKVCQQAVRSGRWATHARFARLCKHLRSREDATLEGHTKTGRGRPTRFLEGGLAVLRQMEQASRVKHVEVEIVVVQPGVQIASLTVPQRTVLAAANAFLLQTANVSLRVVGS